MRITFLSPPPNLSGGQRVVAIYASKLQSRGHSVEIVCCCSGASLFRQAIRGLLSKLRLWNNNKIAASHNETYGVDIRVVSNTGALCDDHVRDGDVIVATFWPTAYWAMRMSSSKGRRVYLVQHDEGQVFATRPEADATYELPMLNVCVSQWIADEIHKRHRGVRQVVIKNSVESERFFRPNAPSVVRGFQVGFMASHSPTKGSDLAIRALELARVREPRLVVHVLSATAFQDLPDWCIPWIQPAPSQLSRLYGMCRMWLFPSRLEGFGLPILEAMACGTPVIGTPAGAAPELLSQGGGILVPYDEPQAMADAILRMFRMQEPEWQAMSDAAYRTATSYTWDDATDLLEQTLLDEIARPETTLAMHDA